MSGFTDPGRDCALCPRLVAFRNRYRDSNPEWHNAPVPGFGSFDAPLLIVGLAPGLQGANKTGRPFTGDYAGDLLYATLTKFGLASGSYGKTPEDSLNLKGARLTNAVRCVPPENKPVGAEVNACRPFLKAEIAEMKNLKAILCLGQLSHNATLRTLGLTQSAAKFGHGAVHHLPDQPYILIDSYHCSRYNTNTGRLTVSMFEAVFETLTEILAQK